MCISLHAKKDLISNYYTLQIVYLYIIVVFTSFVDTIFTKKILILLHGHVLDCIAFAKQRNKFT